MTAQRRLGFVLLLLLLSGFGPAAAQDRTTKDRAAAGVAELRAKLDRRLAAVQSLAGPALTFKTKAKHKGDSLIGVWSGSQEDCRKEKVIFFDFQARKSVEWWRSVDAVGLMPWRSGEWEVREDRVLLKFQRKAEWLPETGSFEEEPFEMDLQLVLAAIAEEQLTLATPEEDDSDFLLLGAPEKRFVRCLL